MKGPRGSRTVWLVCGIAIGFGGGWLIRTPGSFDRAEPRRSRVAGEPEVGPGDREAGPAEPHTEVEATPAKPVRTTAGLVADVEDATRAGDWQAFVEALNALGASTDDAALRKLLELMGDTSIDLTRFPGSRFHKWLKDSTLPGIAVAARARYEANVAAGETSWVGANGWVDLVAEHGTRDDLEWLVRLIDKRLHQQSDQARQALFRARNPAVVEFVRSLLGRTPADNGDLDAFAANHPEAAFRILDEELALGRTAGGRLCAYASCVGEGSLATAKARLLHLTEPKDRIAAVYAVERLQERGVDVTGLDPIVEAPLAVVTAGGDAALVSQALYAIESNERVMWTQQTLDALRSANLGTNDAQRRQLVRMLESRLNSWKTR